MATLSSLLVQRGVATMRGMEDAISRQVLMGGDLATAVLEVGAAREEDITHLAAEGAGLVALGVGRLVPSDVSVLRLLPGEVASRHGIFPIERRGDDLVVATSEPLSQAIEEDLGFLLNLNLRPVFALRSRIAQAQSEHYGLALDKRFARLVAKLEGRKFSPETEPPPALPEGGEGASGAMGATGDSGATGAGGAAGAGGATGAGGAGRVALAPQRPTLRGMPRITGDPANPVEFISTLPDSIELSPRPHDVAVTDASNGSEAARRAFGALTSDESREAPNDAAQRDGRAALHALTSGSATSGSATSGSATSDAATSAGASTGETDVVGATDTAPGGSDVPAALAAWAVPKAEAGRTPRPGRVRRKGPLPAGLAEEEMLSAMTTDGVLEVLFDFAQQFFEYTALFVVHGDIAEGRDGAGRGADRKRVGAIGLPLDLPSTLAVARDRRVPVLGDLSDEGVDAELLRDLGRAPASEGGAASPTAPSQRAAAVVIPIVVRGRSVALLFGDDAPQAVELSGIGEVIAFSALAGSSVERLILRKKLGRTGSAASALRPKAQPSVPTGGALASKAKAVAGLVDGVTNPMRVEGKASSFVATAKVDGTEAREAEKAAPGGSTSGQSNATSRAGVAALARMFSSSGGSAKRGAAAAAREKAKAAAARPDEAPVLEGTLGSLASAVAESLVASSSATDGVLEGRAMAEDGGATIHAGGADARSEGHADEPGAHDEGHADEPGAHDEGHADEPGAHDETDAPNAALLTPSEESIAVALQTSSPTLATAYPLDGPALQTPSFEAQGVFEEAESSGAAATVALLLPGDTSLPQAVGEDAPRDVWEAAPNESEASASDDVDLAFATSTPAAAHLSESGDGASFPVQSFPDDDGEIVDIDEIEDVPDGDLETVEPTDVHLSREVDSGAETAALRVASSPGEPQAMISSQNGRPSGPLVVEVLADSTDGLESAIARAAEAVDARRADRSATQASRRDEPQAVAPPDETLTEGFPAAAPRGAHLSPDVSLGLATPPPPSDIEGGGLTALSLDQLLARATRGPDIADARTALLRRAERNLTPLLALFPGPLDQDRQRSADRLPVASQCGPLLFAIASTGARGAATVAVLARHDDVEVRFWAAHLLGELPSAEAADGLLAFLVDADPAVRRIALRSASSILGAALGGRPLESGLGFLARDAHAPLRERVAAVEAMGQLRGTLFVPILIGLLAATPDDVPDAARRALLVVTRQDHSRDVARWADWWSKNEGRHRIEWLIDSLMHDTQSIRRAAGDELKQLTKEYFGYYDDLPKRERERAQDRYRDWWEREGHARFR